MSTSTLDRPQPARADRRERSRDLTRDLVSTGKRWIVLAVLLVVAGTAAGACAGAAAPVDYTSEVRLSVGSTSLRSLSVPGYVEATEQLASTYARYVDTGSTELSSVAQQIGVDDADLVSVESSPIAESSIVRIRVVATSPEASTRAADALAATLVAAVGQPNAAAATARKKLAKVSDRLARSQQAVSDAEDDLAARVAGWKARNPALVLAGVSPSGSGIGAAQATLSAARARLALDQVDFDGATTTYRGLAAADPSRSEVSVVRPAAVVADSSAQKTQWGALAGFGAGALLGAVVLWVTMRRRSRAAD